MSIDDTLDERGKSYGEFTTQGMYTQRLKELFRDEDGSWEHMDDDMKEALDMIASKIARLINGDPYHIDSWHDIQGYARLVEARLVKEEQDEFDFDKAFDIQEYPTTSPPFLVQPKWEIDPVFHPTASVMGLSKDFPYDVPTVDFHGIHINGHEEIQGREYDELPVFDPGQDTWVKTEFTGWEKGHEPPTVDPGFAEEAFPSTSDYDSSSGMEAAHGALPPDISKL